MSTKTHDLIQQLAYYDALSHYFLTTGKFTEFGEVLYARIPAIAAALYEETRPMHPDTPSSLPGSPTSE